MSKFNIEAFENLIAAAKESTRKSQESSPFLSQGRARAQALAAGIADVKTTLSFDLLDAPDFDIKSVKVQGAGARAGKVDESLTIDKKAEPEKNIIVALNWLVSLSKQIMERSTSTPPSSSSTRRRWRARPRRWSWTPSESRCWSWRTSVTT